MIIIKQVLLLHFYFIELKFIILYIFKIQKIGHLINFFKLKLIFFN